MPMRPDLIAIERKIAYQQGDDLFFTVNRESGSLLDLDLQRDPNMRDKPKVLALKDSRRTVAIEVVKAGTPRPVKVEERRPVGQLKPATQGIRG